jgi:hypothetical protein
MFILYRQRVALYIYIYIYIYIIRADVDGRPERQRDVHDLVFSCSLFAVRAE